MTYRPLDETTIVDYIAQRPSLAGVFSDFSRLSISEVGDGNLNLVFIVREHGQPGGVGRPQAGVALFAGGRRIVAADARAYAL